MKRAVRRQLALIVAVIVLLAAAAWQLRSDENAAPGTLLSFKPETITRVSLAMGATPTEKYVKRDEHWWRIDQGDPVRADDRRIGELIRIAAAPVQSWQPAANYDIAKIGLAPPQAKLTLDDATLSFGSMTAIGHDVYVQTGERVGIVSMLYMPRSAQSTSVQAQ
ncbi:DUF4340 domain-containing protein [Dyella sp. 2HG41-7]|uniref:DUF4340 domain-containing protein n=1 Tax=Dyella sp. 2HG41-7 TaxID=2883239 RepID=UPI001F21FF17|nr:DUF4340 domain-containing protein [Dyella sp. 2HG41-7]